MRLVVLSRSTTFHKGFGGMEIIGEAVVEALTRRGWTVHWITTAHPDGRTSAVQGTVDFEFIPDAPPGVYSEAWHRASAARICALSGTDRPDVIFSQSSAARGYLRHGWPTSGIPAVALYHGLSLWALRSAWQALRPPRGVAHLVRSWVASFREHWVESRYDHRLAGIIAVARTLKDDVVQHLGVPGHRVIYIPNGVDPALFRHDAVARQHWRQELGCGDSPLALMVGRVEWIKGYEDGVRALTHPQAAAWRLVIAGTGPYEAPLRTLVGQLGLASRVRLLGFVQRDRLPGLYSAADAMLSPTLHPEGLPLTLLEAMACNLPLVATPMGGIPTLLDNGVNGLLIDFRSPESIARTLGRLGGDKETRRQMGVQGRNRIESEFDFDSVVHRLDQALRGWARVGTP